MTKLLEQGIQAIRDLPDERQDAAGEILLTVAAQDENRFKSVKESFKKFNEITSVNARSKSFDFLNREPELYSVTDVKKKHA